jgi:hypothetical protein
MLARGRGYREWRGQLSQGLSQEGVQLLHSFVLITKMMFGRGVSVPAVLSSVHVTEMLLHNVKQHNINSHDVMLQKVAAHNVRVPKRKVFKT